MNNSEQTIFITGGTGFIGLALVRELQKQGHTLKLLVRNKAKAESLFENNIEFIQGDLSDIDLLKQVLAECDAVFHLAGQSGKQGVADKVFWQTNVQGSKNMIAAAKAVGVQKFIHVSSTGVMGPQDPERPGNEDLDYNPKDIYETTKAEAEKSVRQAIDKQNFPAVIIRPSIIYGPGDLSNISKLFTAVKNKRFLFIGPGKNLWDLIYIQDLVQGLIAALHSSEAVGQTIILGSGHPATFKKFINLIGASLDKKTPQFYLPTALGKLAGLGFEFLHQYAKITPLFTRSSIDYIQTNRVFNITKARHLLNFSAKVDLPQGINNTVHWYQENLWKQQETK